VADPVRAPQRVPIWLLAFAVLGACASPTGAWRSTPRAQAAMRVSADREDGKRIYATCTACHGEDGAGNNAALVPRIAGQHYSVIIRQLSDFQAERRHDPRMQQAVADHHLQSPQSLANVATYVNLLRTRAPVSLGGAPSGDLGQRLFETNCAACHGAAAQGSDESTIPRLAGQNRDYLIRQFRDIGGSLRPPVGPRHVKLLAPLQYQDRDALADYLSRLR
jgi:cytochrome c553